MYLYVTSQKVGSTSLICMGFVAFGVGTLWQKEGLFERGEV